VFYLVVQNYFALQGQNITPLEVKFDTGSSPPYQISHLLVKGCGFMAQESSEFGILRINLALRANCLCDSYVIF